MTETPPPSSRQSAGIEERQAQLASRFVAAIYDNEHHRNFVTEYAAAGALRRSEGALALAGSCRGS